MNHPQAESETYQASSEEDLNECIQQANALQSAGDSVKIEIVTTTITLSAPLLPINTPGSLTITPTGDDKVTIDGDKNVNAFTVLRCETLTLSSLKIKSCSAKGTVGSLGAGGGLLIANVTDASSDDSNPYVPDGSTPPNVQLNNVEFTKCSALGGSPSGAPGHGHGGRGATSNGYQHDGTSGDTAASLTQGFLDDSINTAGFFGLSGAGGQGGKYGSVGDGGDGGCGDAGERGHDGGYGAGAGPGGGGGGGAGGGPSSHGGRGGDGGDAGYHPGFGGTQGGSPVKGVKGHTAHKYGPGGHGGDGGDGATGGAGAAFGGAIFVMGNATVQLNEGCRIENGLVTGGTDSAGNQGAAAGAGIFLQGAGSLQFDPIDKSITISDSIMDEAGAVACGLAEASSSARLGKDNLPASGGEGEWNISLDSTGTGSLVLEGKHGFSGIIQIQNGVLDLSDYQNDQMNELDINGGDLTYQPPSSLDDDSGLNLGNIHLNASTCFSLNANSAMTAKSIQTSNNPTLSINFDTDTLSSDSVTVIVTEDTLPNNLILESTSDKYSVKAGSDQKSIVVKIK